MVWVLLCWILINFKYLILNEHDLVIGFEAECCWLDEELCF